MTAIESVIYRRGKEASDKLTQALINIAARGLRTHCSDAGTSGLWLSEHEPPTSTPRPGTSRRTS
jgi:hypothetical protein